MTISPTAFLKIAITGNIIWVVLTGVTYLIFRNKSKKTFAFVFNFFIIGSGFIILMGKKGLKLTLIYLIPFLVNYLIGLLLYVFYPRTFFLTGDARDIISLLIYLICYIHLYKVSKKIFLKHETK